MKVKERPSPLEEERYIFKLFRRRARPHLGTTCTTEFEWLATGQHHGLPTRLLDWTRNPLVALYFAVREELENEDGAVYCLDDLRFVEPEALESPFSIKWPCRISPPFITPRLAAQAGIFTIQPDPFVELTTGHIRKVVIPKEHKRSLKRELWRLGFDEATLFCSLDATCSNITWMRTEVY